MSYHCFYLAVPPERYEIVSAWLETLPVEGILETIKGLEVFAKKNEATAGLAGGIEALSKTLAFSYTYEEVEEINWNERWEAGFQPVVVGDFAGVRAEFHAPLAGVSHELIIQPRMAFGTGHHATTWLMMESMARLAWKDKTVFDFGCGTGILAILAAKLGASKTVAVDIEKASVENALENARVNGVGDRIDVMEGGIETVAGQNFGVILANINRNVILASLAALYDRLQPGGDMLISGVLENDFDLVSVGASQQLFKLLDRRQRDGWLVLHYTR